MRNSTVFCAALAASALGGCLVLPTYEKVDGTGGTGGTDIAGGAGAGGGGQTNSGGGSSNGGGAAGGSATGGGGSPNGGGGADAGLDGSAGAPQGGGGSGSGGGPVGGGGSSSGGGGSGGAPQGGGGSGGVPPGLVAVDDSLTVGPCEVGALNVLTNDLFDGAAVGSDVEVSSYTPTTTLTVDPNGSVSYAPSPDDGPPFDIDYTIRDGQGDESTATLAVTVTNAPPAPTADRSVLKQTLDTVATTNALANPGEPDACQGVALVGVAPDCAGPFANNALSAAGVAISADTGTGTADYTPGASFWGSDSYCFQLQDPYGARGAASVNVTVLPNGTTLGATLTSAQGAVLVSEAAGDRAGAAVDGGDVSGDGIPDVIVGAPGADKVYVVFGASDLSGVDLAGVSAGTAPGFVISGLAGSSFGSSVAYAGDVNCDGIGDLIVGAPTTPVSLSGAQAEGAAFVVFGQTGAGAADVDLTAGAGATSTLAHVLTGVEPGGKVGASVAGGQDLNGDASMDFIVSAPELTPTQPQAGRAYVVFGGCASRWATTSTGLEALGSNGVELRVDSSFENLGQGVAMVGNVNGTGQTDLAVSGRGFQVVFGEALGAAPACPVGSTATCVDMASSAGFAFDTAIISDFRTAAVAGLGDTSGDGRADFIGCEARDDDTNGECRVVLGAASTGALGTSTYRIALPGPIRTPLSVARAGDINGDSLADMLIGLGSTVYAVYGRDGVATDLDLAALGRTGGFSLVLRSPGAASGLGGDLNGDGVGDFVVGDPGTGTDTGRVHVVYGMSTTP